MPEVLFSFVSRRKTVSFFLWFRDWCLFFSILLSTYSLIPVYKFSVAALQLLLIFFVRRIGVIHHALAYSGDMPLEESKKKVRQGIFDFCTGTIREVMVPMNDVFKVSDELALSDLTSQDGYCPYSRIPVYRGEKDNIVGILYAKDLIRLGSSQGTEEDISINSIAREAYHVPEVMEQSQLLREFQNRKIQMAVVVDEYGVSTGIVTLEDLVETIIGEIQDLANDDDEFVQQLDLRSWVLDARLELDDFSELVGKSFESETVETLGGYLFEKMGVLPVEGDAYSEGGLEFSITEMEHYRIRRVAVRELAS
jgi:CBS domain containing-hemolysin-like protein